jgi:hypothetical protein
LPHALPDLLGLGASAKHSARACCAIDELGAAQPVALLIAGITAYRRFAGVGLHRPYRKPPYMLITGLVAATAVGPITRH